LEQVQHKFRRLTNSKPRQGNLVNRLTWLTKLLYKYPNLVNHIPIFGGLIFKPMEQTTQSLKELYEKDFYLWVQENLKLLKNRDYDLVDWENPSGRK
jgi:Domain of unknown function DUF29.